MGLVVAFEEAAIRKDGQEATQGALSYRACWTLASWWDGQGGVGALVKKSCDLILTGAL